MLVRQFERCHSCRKPFVMRIGVGLAPEQRFAFLCPSCKAPLRGVMYLDHEKTDGRIESEDFKQIEDDLEPRLAELPAITIYTDIPVHKSIQGKSMAEGGSAFIMLSSLMGGRYEHYQTRAHALHALRLQIFPQMRRAAGFFDTQSWHELKQALVDMDAPNFRPSEHQTPATSFEHLFRQLYEPIHDRASMLRQRQEIRRHFDACRTGHNAAYGTLLSSFASDWSLFAFRSQATHAAVRAFTKFDAAVPGLAFENFLTEHASTPQNFTLARDDFDELKGLYVDIFEVSSRMLAFLGPVLNLSTRGDATLFSDGKRRSLSQFFKARAVDREFVLDELPVTASLFQKIKRHLRNDFGHYKVTHDIATGSIVDEGGNAVPFLLFLADFLAAMRLAPCVMAFAETLRTELARQAP